MASSRGNETFKFLSYFICYHLNKIQLMLLSLNLVNKGTRHKFEGVFSFVDIIYTLIEFILNGHTIDSLILKKEFGFFKRN